VLNEPQSDKACDRPGGDGDGTAEEPRRRPADSPAEDPSAAYAQRRQKRIRRLRELVQDADYDVPADEVAARIIRDALFGAPDPDGPG
jgi:hypothetical protein